jgi:hypothetical protein
MLIAAGDRTVPCTVQTRTTLSPTEAHRIIVPIDLSLVFTGWGHSPVSVEPTTRLERGMPWVSPATPI